MKYLINFKYSFYERHEIKSANEIFLEIHIPLQEQYLKIITPLEFFQSACSYNVRFKSNGFMARYARLFY